MQTNDTSPPSWRRSALARRLVVCSPAPARPFSRAWQHLAPRRRPRSTINVAVTKGVLASGQSVHATAKVSQPNPTQPSPERRGGAVRPSGPWCLRASMAGTKNLTPPSAIAARRL
jgi:hypothetical protein